MGTVSDALEIYQEVLDRISAAIFDFDPAELSKCMALPYRRSFTNRQFIVETHEDMLRDFRARSDMMRAAGVNAFIVLARSAEVLAPDYISGHTVTHTLRDARPVTDSFESRAVLHRQRDGRWAFIEIASEVEVSGFPVDVLRAARGGHAKFDAPEGDARRLQMDALSIYQRYLDATAETVSRGNFEAYAALMIFPYVAHSTSMDVTIKGPNDLRPFYEVIRRGHTGEVGDWIERIAHRAEFVGPDLICGYHTGTVYLGDRVTVAPVASSIMLKRQGTAWKLQSVTNDIDNTEYPFDQYQPGGSLHTQLEVQKRARLRARADRGNH